MKKFKLAKLPKLTRPRLGDSELTQKRRLTRSRPSLAFMSRWQISRMAGNVGFDFLLGLIPWIGAVPDFFFRSNSRNLKIIKRHLDTHHAAGATVPGEVTKRG